MADTYIDKTGKQQTVSSNTKDIPASARTSTPQTSGYAPGAYFSPSTKEIYGHSGQGNMPSDVIPYTGAEAPSGVPINQSQGYKDFAAANPPGTAPTTGTVPQAPGTPTGASMATKSPYTGTSIVDALKQGGQPSDFASRATLAGQQGIQNYTGTADQNTQLLAKYTQGLATAQATGKAPDNAGDAMATIKGSVPGNGYEGAATTDAYLQEEPIFAKIMDSFAEMMSPPKQSESLVSQYQNLLKTSGVEQINTELLNARKVINGTEQDIRNEIQGANGFSTNSQIMAMSVARNKSLIENYNNLLATKDSLMEQINTTVNLSKQDRDYAQQKLENQMNFGFKALEYRDKFLNNAREGYNNVIKAVGYAGLLQSANGDPNIIGGIERSLGLTPGGLQKLAAYTPPLSEEDKLNLDLKRGQLDIQKSNLLTDKAQRANIYDQIKERKSGGALSTQVVEVGGKKFLINSKTGETIKEFSGGGTNDALNMAQTQDSIQTVSTLKSHPGFNNAVGPKGSGFFSRTGTPFTGSKGDFISEVEKLTSQLSLEALIQAKSQGATFGALSDSELRILSSSATKIGSWRKEKDGKVVGYEASQPAFTKELDKINNFARLDYVLKGGNPSDVQAQVMPDKTIWAQNSDGTMTKLQ